MSRPIILGEIKGIKEGHWFEGRKDMMPSSFHRVWGRGIDSDKILGAAAVVLSGGYKDIDNDDVIIYTGAGGRDKNGKQVEDQKWTHNDNAGLIKSCDSGVPVRVIMGHKHKSPLSPKTGYVYVGLYSIVDYWMELTEFGKNKFNMCKFKLVYAGENPERPSPEEIELDHSVKEKRRKEGTVIRIVRDTQMAVSIKELYKYQCQVCGTTIKTKNGFYAEGAHIKPLGRPHDGDDSIVNLTCLCPNHHVMFDKGTFSIDDNLNLIGDISGALNIHEKHFIDKSNLLYHRKSHGYD